MWTQAAVWTDLTCAAVVQLQQLGLGSDLDQDEDGGDDEDKVFGRGWGFAPARGGAFRNPNVLSKVEGSPLVRRKTIREWTFMWHQRQWSPVIPL